MGITRLSIENFKGVGIRQHVDLAPITLLFGPNSAGKSTVLHALNYLNDIICHLDPNSSSTHLGEETLDLGGFKQFVHRHDLNRVVSLTVVLELGEFDLYESAANRIYRKQYELSTPDQRRQGGLANLAEVTSRIVSVTYEVHVAWSDIKSAAYVQSLDIAFNGVRFVKIKSSSDGRRTNIEYLNFEHPVLLSTSGDDWKMMATTAIAPRHLQDDGHALIGLEGATQSIPDWRQPLELSEIWSDDTEVGTLPLILTALLQCLIRGSLETLADELSGLRYLGPLRELPPRDYQPRGHETNWATGLAAWARLYKNPSLMSDVNRWLGYEGLNTGYQVEPLQSLELNVDSPFLGWLNAGSLDANREAIQNALEQMEKRECIVLRDQARDVTVQPNDVGVGISQLLPVVVGALADEVRLFAMEQPEIHVHPRLQVRLGDLLIHAAKDKGKLFLVETHSEHLMLRLLKRIREAGETILPLPGSVSPEDIKVIYVECIDGETRIAPIRISESGRFLDRWPEGFFEERFEEQD